MAQSYSSNQVSYSIAGVEGLGVQGVDYDVEQEKTHVHAVGSAEPTSISTGPKTYSGTITFLQEDFNFYVKGINNRNASLIDLAGFVIVETMINEDSAFTNRLLGCQVNAEQSSTDGTSGDAKLVTCPFVFLGIDRNV